MRRLKERSSYWIWELVHNRISLSCRNQLVIVEELKKITKPNNCRTDYEVVVDFYFTGHKFVITTTTITATSALTGTNYTYLFPTGGLHSFGFFAIFKLNSNWVIHFKNSEKESNRAIRGPLWSLYFRNLILLKSTRYTYARTYMHAYTLCTTTTPNQVSRNNKNGKWDTWLPTRICVTTYSSVFSGTMCIHNLETTIICTQQHSLLFLVAFFAVCQNSIVWNLQ